METVWTARYEALRTNMGRHDSGGGGNRTRVPEWLRASFYVCSLLLWPYRKSVVPFRSGRSSRRDRPVANRPWLPPAVPPVAAAGGLISIAEIRSPSGKARGSGLRCRVRQPERSAIRHFGFGRLFTWPTDQPRHATDAFAHPVEASSPPGCSVLIYARHRPLVNKNFLFHGVPGPRFSSEGFAVTQDPTHARGSGRLAKTALEIPAAGRY
jgi:hypothetical protein